MKTRFYIIIILVTAILLGVLIRLNHAEYLFENSIPALLSLANAVTAYVISKHKQGGRSYQEMMKHVARWTVARFLSMAVIIVLLIITKTVQPVQFIFSFIGFYILHQVIEIGILQLEAKEIS